MLARLRPDPTRARRVLMIAALAIAAGQLATGLALDAAPRKVRFPGAADVLARAHAIGDVPFVLLLGSSRFWRIDVGTVTTALRKTMGGVPPPVVNGAVRAGDPVVADYLVENLLAQGSRPGLVALEISPETIARPAPWVAEHAIRFFTWKDVVAWAPEIVVGDRASRVAAARFTPIHMYRREILTWVVGREPPYLRVLRPGHATQPASHAKPVVVTDEVQPDAAAETVRPPAAAEPPARGPRVWTVAGLGQTRKWLRRYRPDGGAARALEHVLARCNDLGIRVVLVGVPVTSSVRGLYTPEVERAFQDQVERMSRRYAAEFLDYRGRIPDELFKDHHHLNPRGLFLLSHMLAEEVVAPRWQHAGPDSTSNRSSAERAHE